MQEASSRRNISLIVMSIVLSTVAVHGQLYDHDFYIGIKGAVQNIGIANQNNYGQKEMQYVLTFGAVLGLTAEYTITDKASLTFEACFQQQGQTYDDVFNNKAFYRKVRMRYLTFPIMYRQAIGKQDLGYQAVGSFWHPRWFVGGGLQFGTLLSADATWKLNGQETDFLMFVTDDGNPNQAILDENGIPDDVKDFYREFDVVLVGALGFHNSISQFVTLTVELRGGIGLTDINTPEWQLPNRQGDYGASRTMFFGVHAGIATRVFSKY